MLRRTISPVWPVTLGLLFACASPSTEDAPSAPAAGDTPSVAEPAVEGTSLLGRQLMRPSVDAEFRAKHEALLAEAEARLVDVPGDVDALIWLGRRTAYLGRYQDAVAIYSEGLERIELDPQQKARLLRHRGHRLLSLRKLDRAAADFELAGELTAGEPDRVEADGLPNARNIPTSTLGTNIWYHLGLVRYLSGDFAGARAAYERCMELSKNPDMHVATAYWLYMTLARLGQMEAAAAVLEPITAELDIIENQAYHRLLLAYRGELELDELLRQAESAGPAALATTGYGVGNGYFLGGDEERATEIWRRIVDGDAWASFGHIAAEAELARRP